MRSFYKKLEILFFFLATFLMFAQQPVSIHLTEDDGLPDTEFYDIIEDDDGVIWLAADKGLFKYDGASYTSFTHPDQIGLSVFQLQKDEDNVIWFSNTANQIFNVKNGRVTLFLELKNEFQGKLATTLVYKDLLILQSGIKILVYNKNTSKIVYKQEAIRNDKEKYVEDFTIEARVIDNEIVFGNRLMNFYKVNIETFTSTYFNSSFVSSKTKSRGFISPIYFKNQIIFHSNYKKSESNYKTFYSIPSSFATKPLELQTNFPNVHIQLVRVLKDQLWYFTDNGIYVCDFQNNELKVVRHLFKNKYVTGIVQDVNENYWFTTLRNGVYVVSNIEINNMDVPVKNSQISDIFLGNTNELLLTTSTNKIVRFNLKKETVEILSLKDDKDIYKVKFNPFKKEYLVSNRYNVQFYDENFKPKNQTINTSVIKSFSFINEDAFIYASSARISALRYAELKEIKLFNKGIRGYACLYDHKNKRSYFGTPKGFYGYSQNWVGKEIKYQGKSIFIKDIAQANDGSLWCLSFKNGIYVIEKDKVIEHYTVKNGLLSNKNSFIRAKENIIWLAGEKGIQKINIETGVFKKLTKQNGIPSYNFTGLEVLGNNVYVSSIDQLYTFDSEKVFQSKKILEPYFTSVSIDDEKKVLNSKYYLNHDQKKINIVFNSNGFLSKNNVEYKYRLLGSGDHWETIPLGTNLVNFNSLSHGKYTFQLKAFNSTESSKIKEIQFIIAGVFYEQLWFYIVVSILIICLFWVYFSVRNKRLKNKQSLLLDKQSSELENVFLKLENLRSQMNPHFIFNALNSIQDYIIRKEQKLARKYLVKFSRLIRIYLEHSQKDSISLQEELDALKLYLDLEKDRFEDTFSYTINLPEKIKSEAIQIPTFLLQPYVENAIKHGLLHRKKRRLLEVSFALNKVKTMLVCTIKDNGIGRAASVKINAKRMKPKSFSSEANKKRIDLLNKTHTDPIRFEITDDYDESGIALGTTVQISIPIM